MNGASFKKVIAYIVVLAFFVTLIPQPVLAAQDLAIIVEVDGEELIVDQPPVIVNSRVLVPMRAIFEKLGTKVEWNGNTQTVTANKDGILIQLTIGVRNIKKNGATLLLDQAPLIVGGRTMVPVRAVAEALGAEVGWDAATRTVMIDQGQGVVFDPQLIPHITNESLMAQANDGGVYDLEAIRVIVQGAMEKRLARVSFRYYGSIDEINNNIAEIVNKTLDEMPYYDNTFSNVEYRMEGNDTLTDVVILFTHRMTADQDAYTMAKAKEIIQQIITPEMNEIDKVRAIHDYIVKNYEYDLSYSIYDPYPMLIQKKGVCQAYTLLAYVLLKTAGIQNTFVTGEADGVGHGWNLVFLRDGRIYHMDTTWDDPVPDQGNRVRYDYFLKTDAQMAKDHVWQHGDYPASSRTPVE